MRLFFLTLALSLLECKLYACTHMFWTHSKICARTMDLDVEDSPEIVISPAGIERWGKIESHALHWISKYETVTLTAFQKGVSEGMNEKGLAAHVLYLTETKYEPRDSRPGLSNTVWVQYLVDQYASVQEVLNSVDTFQIVPTELGGRVWPLYLCIEDVCGDSAMIEFKEGKMVIRHETVNAPPIPKNTAEAFEIMHTFYSKKDSWPTRWISVMDLSCLNYTFRACPIVKNRFLP